MDGTTEGWMAEKPYHVRRYHYIQNTRALCGGHGFYLGELTPDNEAMERGAEDCAACFKRLRRLRPSRDRQLAERIPKP
jgi:hypothetical protein